MGLFGSGMGFLGMGPKAMNNDFNYDVNQVDYQPSQQWNDAIARMGQQGSRLNQQGNDMNTMMRDMYGRSGTFLDKSLDMMDPGGQMITDQMNFLGEDLATAAADNTRVMNSALMQQGVSGGIRDLLGSGAGKGNAEALRKGRAGFTDQNMKNAIGVGGLGANLGSTALGFGQGATSAFGQAGNLFTNQAGQRGQQDANLMNISMANTNALNTRNQYVNQMNYDQDAANKARADSFNSSLLNAGVSLATGGLGGGMFGSKSDPFQDWMNNMNTYRGYQNMGSDG